MAITGTRPNPHIPEYQEEIINAATAKKMQMLFDIGNALDDGEEGESSLEDALANLRNVFIDDSEEGQPYVDPKFAYNPGAFTINKAPEDISVQDVIDAYELEDLFEGIPLLDLNTGEDKLAYPYLLDGVKMSESEYTAYTGPFIITGEALGLIWGKEENNVEISYYTYNKTTWDGKSNLQVPIKTSINIRNRLTSEHISLLKDFTGREPDEGKTEDTVKYYLADIGRYNMSKLRSLDSNCVGLKLRHIYPILGDGSFNADAPILEQAEAESAIIFKPKTNFIIDGEVNGKAEGGFHSNYMVLSTSHSLYLHKVIWVKYDSVYWSMFIDCSKDGGIEQLRVEGCVFEGLASSVEDPHTITNAEEGHNYGEFYCRENRYYAGAYFYLYFDEASAWDNSNQQLVQKNQLKHLYFYDNAFYGSRCINSIAARFVGTCRYINNCFYMGTMSDNYRNGYYVNKAESKKWTICDQAIGHSVDNNKSNTIYHMTYYSCPMWFVGNKFFGSPEIMAERSCTSKLNAWYYCGIVTETSSSYILWNTFQNFVTRSSIRMTDNPTRLTRPETYDCYTSNIRVYHCNNHITNVLHISPYRGVDIGLTKGKNLVIPSDYQYSDFYDTIRYYKNNVFDVDKEWIDAAWVRGVEDGQFYGADTFCSISDYKTYRTNILNYYRMEDVVENGEVKSVSKSNSYYEWALDLPRNERPKTYYKMFGEKSWDKAMSTTELVNGEEVVTGVNPDFIYYVMANTKEFDDTPLAVSEFTFSNNVFDMGEGCIGGMRSNTYFFCVKFVCQNNEFHTSKAVSTIGANPPAKIEVGNAFWQAELSYARNGGPDEAVFNVLPTDLYKVKWGDTTKQVIRDYRYSPSIVMTGNKFYIDNQEQNSNYVPVWVRMLKVSIQRPWKGFSSYTKEEIANMMGYSLESSEANFIGNIMDIRENAITQPESSSVRNGLVISFGIEGEYTFGTPIKITTPLEPND